MRKPDPDLDDAILDEEDDAAGNAAQMLAGTGAALEALPGADPASVAVLIDELADPKAVVRITAMMAACPTSMFDGICDSPPEQFWVNLKTLNRTHECLQNAATRFWKKGLCVEDFMSVSAVSASSANAELEHWAVELAKSLGDRWVSYDFFTY